MESMELTESNELCDRIEQEGDGDLARSDTAVGECVRDYDERREVQHAHVAHVGGLVPWSCANGGACSRRNRKLPQS
jgi:hypothetical protein